MLNPCVRNGRNVAARSYGLETGTPLPVSALDETIFTRLVVRMVEADRAAIPAEGNDA